MSKKLVAIILLLVLTAPAITFMGNNSYRNENTNTLINTQIIEQQKSLTAPIINVAALPYQVKILFDEAHAQYFDSSLLSNFLEDLKTEFGASVDINKDPFDSILLDQYDLIILMDPNSNLTESEISALQNYLETDNGTVLVAGTWYKYFDPWQVNFTKKYGVDWYDASTNDPTNNMDANYYPIVHEWANTTVARFVSNDSDFKVVVSGTALKITGSNDSTKTIYRVGVGDNDSYLVLENGTELHLNESINYFVAVDLTPGGRFFAAGSAQLLRNDFYASYDNRLFALRVVHWLLAEGLEVTSFEAPSELYVGEAGYVNFTIKNNAGVTATNVQIGIELGNGIGLKNNSNPINIGNLAPGEEKSFSWEINGTSESASNITVKVWCDNLPGFSKGAKINIKLPAVEIKAIAKPNRVLLNLRNNFTLEIYAYAPRIFDVDNVVINVNLPTGLSTSQGTTINIGHMSAGEMREIDLVITCSTKGEYEITITSSGTYAQGDLKSFTASVTVYVYDIMILFDQGHGQYYDADRMQDFINVLYGWGYVYLNNNTFVEENVTNADVIVIPNPEEPLTNEEIALIRNYINNGGSVIIMGTMYEYLNATCLNSLTQSYGITWESGVLLDDTYNMNGNERIPVLSNFNNASIIAEILLKDVSSLAFSYSTYLSLSGDAIPIIYGNPTTKVNTSQGLLDISGGEIIAGAVYQNDNGGKIIALGSTGLFAYDLDEEDTKFAENILNWILGSKVNDDNEPPTIEISPLDNPYINVDEATITWSASDNKGVNYFVLYIDDKFEAIVGSSVNEYTFTGLSNGEHIVKIYAVDVASLYNYDNISFVIDTEAPVITVISPESGASVYAGEIALNFTLSDLSGVAKVEIYIDGELNKTISNPGQKVETTIYITDIGEHTVTIIAYDLAGNSNSVIIDLTVVEKPSGVGPTGFNMLYVAIAVIVAVIVIAGYIAYSKRK